MMDSETLKSTFDQQASSYDQQWSRLAPFRDSLHLLVSAIFRELLEYRVWCYPARGAADLAEGSDYFYPFDTNSEALTFSQETQGADEPLALVLQEEYISEPEPGRYVHVAERRITEWPVVFLRRPKRTARTIRDFMAPDAPANRLDIIRRFAKPVPTYGVA